jgi:predicted amidophosphoribosyltransferase
MKLTRPPDGVDEAWVLDWHFAPPGSRAVDGDGRTCAGQLLYRAKYQGDRQCAAALANLTCNALRCVPASALARHWSWMVTLPRSDDNQLALSALQHAAMESLGVGPTDDLLTWQRPVPKMKNVDPDDRARVIASALVSVAPLGGTVVVVDDIIDTGATMSEAARALREAGATRVVAIAATKICR